MSAESQPPRAVRLRGREACHSCHERKVRCDVRLTGTPCTNCTRDAADCRLRSRKPYAARTPYRHALPARDSNMPDTESGGPSSTTSSAVSPPQDSVLIIMSDVGEIGSDAPIEDRDGSTLSLGRSTEIGRAMVTAIIDGSPAGESPLFIGDQQGIGYILDAMSMNSPAKPQHFLIPRRTAGLLESDDLIYLKAKGCFSLPSNDVCKCLLTCYFHHVHPTLPIIDMGSFLKSFKSEGVEGSNLLLLWSMFSVAGSYMPNEALESAGFSTRKEMKYSMYRRAKCLFESGSEEDITILTQSAILLGFWYSNSEGRTGSWHWTGQAISLAQTLGMHRNIDARQVNTVLSDSRRRLWRRVWWVCFFRDRWLSLGMGRPMRICADDCDVPMPTLSDVMIDLEDLSSNELESFLPEDMAELSHYWICFLNLSIILGDILAKNYRPRNPRLNTSQINQLENDVAKSVQRSDNISGSSVPLKYISELLLLQNQAVLITLYRPFLLPTEQTRSDEQEVSSVIARQKINLAATNTNLILERIVAEDMVKFLGPMIPPLLVPAMHSHLLDSKSENSLTRSLGLHRLDLCLLILEEMEHNFPAANVIRMLFVQAKDKKLTAHQPKLSANKSTESPMEDISDGAISSSASVDPFNASFFTGKLYEDIFNNPLT